MTLSYPHVQKHKGFGDQGNGVEEYLGGLSRYLRQVVRVVVGEGHSREKERHDAAQLHGFRQRVRAIGKEKQESNLVPAGGTQQGKRSRKKEREKNKYHNKRRSIDP